MILILMPDRNSPPKNDYTGAFLPVSRALVKHYPGRVVVVKVPVPVVDPRTLTISGPTKQAGFEQAAAVCLDAIDTHKSAHIVFLCHGWSGGLQLGFRNTKQKKGDASNFDLLCDLLRSQRPALRSVTLFACSAGDEPESKKSSPGTGDNSFADILRDRSGVPVLAHWTAGHTTRNPDLIYFDASDVPVKGGFAVTRGTPLWRAARRRLHDESAWLDLPTVASAAEMEALILRP